MIDESDKLPERRVESIRKLRLSFVRIVLVRVDLFIFVFLDSFNRCFLLFKHSVDVLEVLFLLTIA